MGVMKFNKLTPNFSVRDVTESVKFYQDMLGFELEMAVPDGSTKIENEISDEGEYAYAMMSKDEVYVMFLKEDSFKYDIPLLHELPQGASVLFYIEVDNIEKMYKQLESRAEIAKTLETTWYGMREFYIRDCNGYILGFAERE
jgi:uncharacterized glyoxalase superfamily protein PhnB